MFRRSAVLWLCTLGFVATAGADDAPLRRYDRVVIAPTQTSVYVGRVTMTMPPFVRRHGVYESAYTARVFPFFFLNEKGRLAIAISDGDLRRVARGEPVEFSGYGLSETGVRRRLEGRAVPAGANAGTITVRVFVSRRIQLIFHTTYRFASD